MAETIAWTLEPVDPETFTGTAFSRLLASARSEVPIRIYGVRFRPEARTHWHTHPFRQLLLVTSGRCRYQRAGGPILEASAGESIAFEPGELHWHGAGPHEPAEHLAINLGDRATIWGEAVREEEPGDAAEPAAE